MSYEVEFPQLSRKGVLETAQSNAGLLWQKLMRISPSFEEEFAEELFCQVHSLRHELQASKENDVVLHANLTMVLHHLFCMVAFIRDIHDGLGYRKLTYQCILSFYRCFPILGKEAVRQMLFDPRIGCWRDGPGLCVVISSSSSQDHPLISLVVDCMNEALAQNMGTVAKWIPRETSRKQKWLFEKLAIDWSWKHDHYYPSSPSALRKCFMKYRKRVASLSSCFAEQKLCGHRPLDCVRDVTHSNLAKHWNCFFAQTPGLFCRDVSSDRQLFANSLARSLENRPCVGEKRVAVGLSFPVHMDVYVGLARKCMLLLDQTPPNVGREVEALNHLMGGLFSHWRKRVDDMGWALPVIDVEVFSLEDPILHRAIGYAYFVARKSGVHRILFCAHQPLWIHLDSDCDDFFRGMQKIFTRLQGEIILNTRSVETSLGILGSAHPFSLYVIRQNGSCGRLGEEFHYRSLEKHIQRFRGKYDSLFQVVLGSESSLT